MEEQAAMRGTARAAGALRIDVVPLFLALVDELRPPTPLLVTEYIDSLRVETDAELLDAVLRRLVENAIAHASHRSEIRIELGARPGCSFFVRDNGGGFPMPARAAPACALVAVTALRGGRLEALARRLEAAGGSLRVQGEPGWGASFYVLLPGT